MNTEVKERPALFQGSMSRALRNDTKGQTRRLVTGQALEWLAPGMFSPAYVADRSNGLSPYGYPGDVLWVREAFSYVRGQGVADRGDVWFWAEGEPLFGDWTKPKPSIHMPRWACRTRLLITDLRIERLRDISEEDAKAEGVLQWAADLMADNKVTTADLLYMQARYGSGSVVCGYAALWDSINGDAGPNSWDGNPWVWVISFRRVKP